LGLTGARPCLSFGFAISRGLTTTTADDQIRLLRDMFTDSFPLSAADFPAPPPWAPGGRTGAAEQTTSKQA